MAVRAPIDIRYVVAPVTDTGTRTHQNVWILIRRLSALQSIERKASGIRIYEYCIRGGRRDGRGYGFEFSLERHVGSTGDGVVLVMLLSTENL
jgi:hypothetical protein